MCIKRDEILSEDFANEEESEEWNPLDGVKHDGLTLPVGERRLLAHSEAIDVEHAQRGEDVVLL